MYMIVQDLKEQKIHINLKLSLRDDKIEKYVKNK